jgi:uncharacterized membrane protein
MLQRSWEKSPQKDLVYFLIYLTNMPSQLWSVQTQDFVKGLVVAVLTSVLTVFVQMIQTGGQVDLKQVGIAALVAGSAYLLKQFGSDESGKVLGKI